ncbi:hypothetical protein [Polaribacter aestuariivivens]|uniref:hypothetical protein n=1 Tax=Polaribacter aestuariivivens TaxID=2304626 RepID=UPI003F49A3EA
MFKISRIHAMRLYKLKNKKMDELTSFGNYLLSKEREEIISDVNKRNVTHADYENWKHITNCDNKS